MRLVSVAEVPDLPADPARVESVADSMRAHRSGVVDAGRRVSSAWRGLDSVYDTPETATAAAQLATVETAVGEWDQVVQTVAGALEDYAAILAPLKREIDTLGPEIESFRRAVIAFQDSQREIFGDELEPHMLVDYSQLSYNDELRRRCDAARTQIELAADDARRRLATLSGPSVRLPAGSSVTALGELGAAGTARMDTALTTAILDALLRAGGPDGDPAAVAAFLEQNPDYLAALSAAAADPGVVARWWQEMGGTGSSAAGMLIAGAALVVGNLNGVPAPDRVAANAKTARDRRAVLDLQIAGLEEKIAGFQVDDSNVAEHLALTDSLKALKSESDYLRRVDDGTYQLYLYDPGRERIVQMIGDPSTAKYSVTYVPGTTTDMNSFYGGGIQAASKYLVEEDLAGTTVAFVYKDGPWASWMPWDETSNASKEFALTEGRQLAQFQEALSTTVLGSGTKEVGVAHSAGMSILSSAEVAGARYDQVSSLAGSWLQDSWSPRSTTEYDHHQYGFDAINFLDPFYDTPGESSHFEQHRYEGEKRFGFIDKPIDNHNRVNEGPRRNEAVLDQLYREIHE